MIFDKIQETFCTSAVEIKTLTEFIIALKVLSIQSPFIANGVFPILCVASTTLFL